MSNSRLNQAFTLGAAALSAAAVYQELRQPGDRRVWHGKVAKFIPYDFRMPTASLVRERMWNEKGPLLQPQVFGVGWTLNVAPIVARLRNR